MHAPPLRSRPSRPGEESFSYVRVTPFLSILACDLFRGKARPHGGLRNFHQTSNVPSGNLTAKLSFCKFGSRLPPEYGASKLSCPPCGVPGRKGEDRGTLFLTHTHRLSLSHSLSLSLSLFLSFSLARVVASRVERETCIGTHIPQSQYLQGCLAHKKRQSS